jgi:hypothetical protein
MIEALGSSMSDKTERVRRDPEMNAFAKKLADFHAVLDSNIEEELPYLATEEKKDWTQSWFKFVPIGLLTICMLYAFYTYMFPDNNPHPNIFINNVTILK